MFALEAERFWHEHVFQRRDVIAAINFVWLLENILRVSDGNCNESESENLQFNLHQEFPIKNVHTVFKLGPIAQGNIGLETNLSPISAVEKKNSSAI